MTAPRKLTFTLSPAARWWMTAFFIGMVVSAIVGRFFADAMPSSDDLPRATQAGLRLFAGILVGMVIQSLWWVGRRAARHS
jgi:hypothetical protein